MKRTIAIAVAMLLTACSSDKQAALSACVAQSYAATPSDRGLMIMYCMEGKRYRWRGSCEHDDVNCYTDLMEDIFEKATDFVRRLNNPHRNP